MAINRHSRRAPRRDAPSDAIMLTSEPGADTGVKRYPTLKTERLILRAFTLKDASDVQRLTGDWEVARTLLSVPHPYENGMAEEWISEQRPAFERGEGVNFAVVLRGRGELCGSIGLLINSRDANAELGYWIGVSYWGQGYAAEAAREVVRYGFEQLGLHRIYAAHSGNNAASGRVLRKIGMSYEGTHREHPRKWGEYEDRVEYGLLVGEWRAAQRCS
jgi:ribosomal-protein-alanine N-acetyltransferase